MTRKCKVCKCAFEPRLPMQAVCGMDCAKTLAVSLRGKLEKVKAVRERKETRAKLDKLKTRGQWQAEAQTAFNAFIRARDAGQPCICCGRYRDSDIATGGTWDAGHYRSRGSAPHLRFDERNVHAQLKQCNRYASGNIVGYRVGLVERIGPVAVDALEADQAPRKFSIDDLKQIKTTYAAKTRELLKASA